MKRLSAMAQMRAMMTEFERDVGLHELTQFEKDLLYTFQLLRDRYGSDFVTSDALKSEGPAAQMRHATFHRSLKKLIEIGLVEHAPNTRAKLYRLRLTDAPLRAENDN